MIRNLALPRKIWHLSRAPGRYLLNPWSFPEDRTVFVVHEGPSDHTWESNVGGDSRLGAGCARKTPYDLAWGLEVNGYKSTQRLSSSTQTINHVCVTKPQSKLWTRSLVSFLGCQCSLRIVPHPTWRWEGKAEGIRRENNRSFTFGTLLDPCKCVFLRQALTCVLSL